MLCLADYVNIDENRSYSDGLSAIGAESINCVDHVAACLGPLGRDMKSPKGFAAAIVFLLVLPAAAVSQIVVGARAETVVHGGSRWALPSCHSRLSILGRHDGLLG